MISMYVQPALIQAVMDAGTSGYLLKDDVEAIQQFDKIIETITEQEVYYSPRTLEVLKTGQQNEVTLTRSEQEALFLMAAHPNATTAELAQQMSMAASTFRNHQSAAYLKLGVSNRSAAIERARQVGLLPRDPNPPES